MLEDNATVRLESHSLTTSQFNQDVVVCDKKHLLNLGFLLVSDNVDSA